MRVIHRRPSLHELLHFGVGEIVAAPKRPVLDVGGDVVREHVALQDDVSTDSREGARENGLFDELFKTW